MRDRNRTFLLGLLLLVGAAVLMYLPVAAGYVPFPADIVLFFPPWEGVAKGCCAAMQHAELGDLATQTYPWRTVLNSAASIGRAPLWNFHYLMGAPYEAMPQSELFFPLNWLYSIARGPLAWSLLFIVRTALLEISMAIFMRRLGASNAAALISGLAFGFSGWITAFEGWPLADTAMWLPLMFLTVDGLRQKPSATWIALGAVAFALPVLGGHPEVAFQIFVLALLYAAFRVFPATTSPVSYLASLGAAGLLAAGLAAVQLLPTIEWIHLIPRSLTAFWPPIPSKEIVAFLSRDIFHQPNIDGISVPEHAAYVGAFAIAALPFAWLWPNPSTSAGNEIGSGSATQMGSLVVGAYSEAWGNACVALGFECGAGGPYLFPPALDAGIAIGCQSNVYADQAIAIGKSADAWWAGSIAIGPGAMVLDAFDSTDSVALGSTSTVIGMYSIAMGLAAVGDLTIGPADYSVSIGFSTHVYSDNAVAVGPSAIGSGPDGVAIGHQAVAGQYAYVPCWQRQDALRLVPVHMPRRGPRLVETMALRLVRPRSQVAISTLPSATMPRRGISWASPSLPRMW